MIPAVVPAIQKRRASRSQSATTATATPRSLPAATNSTASKPAAHHGAVNPGRKNSAPVVPVPAADARADRSRSRSRPENQVDARYLGANLNINRWSHSTSSSISAIESEASRPRANTSRRLSVGPSLASTASASSDPDRMSSMVATSSSHPPDPRRLAANAGLLHADRPPHPRDASPAAAPLTPTSMYNPKAGDYLGDAWQGRRTAKTGEPVAMSVHYMRAGAQHLTRPPPELASQYTLHKVRPDAPRDRRGPPARRDDLVDPANPTHVPVRSRSHRSPTQKTMLSKALAKANTAVLMDNAQNFDGAIEAYAEACDLLQQVLVRSSDLDDRKKLSAIRATYSNRIAELHDLDDSFAGLMEKELPEDPPYDETNTTFFAHDAAEPDTADVLESVQIPPRQESLLPEIFGGEAFLSDPATRKRIHIPSLAVPMDAQYMPPPLSPRNLPPASAERDDATPIAPVRPTDVAAGNLHAREVSSESTSWLDTFEDGDSSSRSSRLSSIDFGLRRNRPFLDDIEAEFDAALNAAVDAAYDDNLAEEATPRPDRTDQDFATESTASSSRRSLPSQRRPADRARRDRAREYDDDDDGNSSDEEERILGEMTRGYVFDGGSFEDAAKPSLPRQSDSSTFSGHTLTSSIPSTTATNATTLSTLAETQEPAPVQTSRAAPPTRDPPPTKPPDEAPPPAPSFSPPKPASRPTSIEKHPGLGLRDRRFSGQSGKQLKIETFARRNSSGQALRQAHLPLLGAEPDAALDRHRGHPAAAGDPTGPSVPLSHPITPMTSIPTSASTQSESPDTPGLTGGDGSPDATDDMATPLSPARGGPLPSAMAAVRKNESSSSLRTRNFSVATTDTNNDSSFTLASSAVGHDAKKSMPPPPASTFAPDRATAFGPHLLHSGGLYLFDDHTATPTSPESVQSASAPPLALPQPLEPCPDSFLLRPFWLMRCLYQTLAHPRGGYITTKLFIPRDIWRVRNVKLKAIDDKVSQCDLLTAALLKLAKVDTFDADAVLEELQSFETVLDQVRSALHKKFGNEVGFSASMNLFKGSGDDQDPGKTTSSTTKSFASGWRKLRSKSSTPAIGPVPGHRDGSLAGLSMDSLPMTSSSAIQSSRSYGPRSIAQPPTPTQLSNIQPVHATYMSCLARLFSAAQILDGIARQVEDPGLKCSSKTQVGLELGVKNAAEFFAFYVLRLVMSDLTLMVDKFLKRGSEWVLT